jgi:predicted RNase H-like HicB family nuclease
MKLSQNFTAVFEKVEDGFVAFIEEIPGVNTQGNTLEEARLNLMEALEMVIAVRREIAEESLSGKNVIIEPIRFVA